LIGHHRCRSHALTIPLSEREPGHPKRQIDTNLAFYRQRLQGNRAMGSADEDVGAEAKT
jgi:hypothetical protein